MRHKQLHVYIYNIFISFSKEVWRKRKARKGQSCTLCTLVEAAERTEWKLHVFNAQVSDEINKATKHSRYTNGGSIKTKSGAAQADTFARVLKIHTYMYMYLYRYMYMCITGNLVI